MNQSVWRSSGHNIVGRCSSITSHYPLSPKNNLWPNWSALYASEALLVSMSLFRHDSSFCKTSSWNKYDYQYSDGSYIFEPWWSNLTMELWYIESSNATGVCRCYPWKRCTSQQLLWVHWWTVRPISRPGQHQRIVYNGHKRVHSLKLLVCRSTQWAYWKYVWACW